MLKHYNSSVVGPATATPPWPPKMINFVQAGRVFFQNLSATLAIQVYTSVEHNRYVTVKPNMYFDFGDAVMSEVGVRTETAGSAEFEIMVTS